MYPPLTSPPPVVAEKPKGVDPRLLGLYGAAFLGDLGTTLAGFHHGMPETNPIAKPLAKLGTVPFVLGSAALGALAPLASRELKKRGVKGWWAPLVAGTLTHSLATYLNAKALRAR